MPDPGDETGGPRKEGPEFRRVSPRFFSSSGGPFRPDPGVPGAPAPFFDCDRTGPGDRLSSQCDSGHLSDLRGAGKPPGGRRGPPKGELPGIRRR